MNKPLLLIVDLKGGGAKCIATNSGARAGVAEWLLTCMEQSRKAIFRDNDDEIHAVICGDEIAGFSFETPQPHPFAGDDELLDLQKRRLRAEVKHLEGLNSGDDWKNEEWE